ncbi:hypothetical protein Taro_025371 [Colocasia esculenta]|uniref:Uncharacterized protein n=1 Tax=Colocasia esculenta TaxID=4460 RepID=A0A843V8Q3_COLES|nr:hypothetical protein [Colocasia esculenta]
MVELRSGRRVETKEIPSTSGVHVDTSRGWTPERLEAPAPPALLPPRVREFRNPAKVKIRSSYARVLHFLFDSDRRQRYLSEGITFPLRSVRFLTVVSDPGCWLGRNRHHMNMFGAMGGGLRRRPRLPVAARGPAGPPCAGGQRRLGFHPSRAPPPFGRRGRPTRAARGSLAGRARVRPRVVMKNRWSQMGLDKSDEHLS